MKVTLPGSGAGLAHDPENRSDFRKGSSAKSKSYSVLCASKRTRGAVICLLLAFSTVVKL
jgi:hypothetical protein